MKSLWPTIAMYIANFVYCLQKRHLSRYLKRRL